MKGDQETVKYKNLYDWMSNRQIRPSLLCELLVTPTVGLVKAKQYFDALYKFEGKPLTDDYLTEKWNAIEAELWKISVFTDWLTWFISSESTSAECKATATIHENHSISVTYVDLED